MQCRQCGTEIADKALICYRCGTATTEAKYKPVPLGPRRSPINWVLGAAGTIALVAAVLYAAC